MQPLRFGSQKAIARHFVNLSMHSRVQLIISFGIASFKRRAAGLIRVGQFVNFSIGRSAGGKPHGHAFQLCHHFKHFDKF